MRVLFSCMDVSESGVGIIAKNGFWGWFRRIHVSRYVSKIIMLTTSVEAICLNYRPKKDNTYPLMPRLTKSGKRKYVSLGLSVEERFRDIKKNTETELPRPRCHSCSNRAQVQTVSGADNTVQGRGQGLHPRNPHTNSTSRPWKGLYPKRT